MSEDRPVPGENDNSSTPGGGQGELDLSGENAPPPPDSPPSTARLNDVDWKQRIREITASGGVWALMGLIYSVVWGSFFLMLRIEHIELHHVELWIFATLALITIVSGRILRYLDPRDD